VRSVHLEPDAPDHTLEALEAELESIARWLGLDEKEPATVGS
jgi:uncharacterized protein YcaQ